MKHHLNTLFILTPGAYLTKEGETVVIRRKGENHRRLPLHALGGIVTIGALGVSPALMDACAKAGVSITFLARNDRFLARVVGPTSGNVLLRREQYRREENPEARLKLARPFVLAKIANTRATLRRAARERADGQALGRAADRLSHVLDDARRADSLDVLRGHEGEAAKLYFDVFNDMITVEGMTLSGRSRRPPKDPVNAMLSFLYALLAHDARSACEAVGLDPQVGFLHADRPGRPGLALDLMEELRAFLVDRVVLALINRRQVRDGDFQRDPAGGVRMNDATRKKVYTAYHERKHENLKHPYLDETTTIGLIVHLQARLLARHLRGESDGYPPFLAY